MLPALALCIPGSQLALATQGSVCRDVCVVSLCGVLEACGSVWGKPLEAVNIANSFSTFLIFFLNDRK